MKIAQGSTGGPDFINLQIGLWKHAVTQFEQLKRVGDGATSDLLTCPEDGDDEYSYNQFEPDAAVAIVLAGTSLSQLLGQNVSRECRRNDGDIPGFWPCVQNVLGLEKTKTPDDFQEFYDCYECLKHFGEPHVEQLGDFLSAEKLSRYMRAAQAFWIRTLEHLGMPVPQRLFTHDFVLEVEEIELTGSPEKGDDDT